MRASETYAFDTEPALLREAMLAASKTMVRGRHKLVSFLITAGVTILAGLGGMAVVTAIAQSYGASPTWWALIGWFAGGGLYLVSFQLLYREVALYSAGRRLHTAPQSITFDEHGMTYRAGAAQWFSPWAMIDGIVPTRHTVTLSIAGVAFPIPNDAIGDDADVKALVADLRAQLAHA